MTKAPGAIHLVNSAHDIHMSISSRVFLGEGLFETMAVRSGRVLCASQHFSRMAASASSLQIPWCYNLAEWHAALGQLLSNETADNGGIKAVLLAGKAERGLVEISQHSILYLFFFPEPVQTKALRLITAPWRRDAQNPIYQHKTINYLEAIHARRLAQTKEADDMLFCDLNGWVLEACVANVFVVLNHTLVTPDLNGAVLPGIARERMIGHARSLGIDVEERSLLLPECEQADAIFLSNALQPLQSVCALNNQSFSIEHELVTALKQAEQRFSGMIEKQK